MSLHATSQLPSPLLSVLNSFHCNYYWFFFLLVCLFHWSREPSSWGNGMWTLFHIWKPWMLTQTLASSLHWKLPWGLVKTQTGRLALGFWLGRSEQLLVAADVANLRTTLLTAIDIELLTGYSKGPVHVLGYVVMVGKAVCDIGWSGWLLNCSFWLPRVLSIMWHYLPRTFWKWAYLWPNLLCPPLRLVRRVGLGLVLWFKWENPL